MMGIATIDERFTRESGGRGRGSVRVRFIVLLTAALVVSTCLSGSPAAGSPVVSAFHKLGALAGEWEGKDDQGGPVKSTFKLVVAGTTVMETLSPGGMEEMMTLYSVDGDGIALLHYCPTNNQPRMRAKPSPGEIKELAFTFQGAGNLPTPETGHEHKLVIEFRDKDHIVEHWTWRKNGKDTEMVYHLTRKSSAVEPQGGKPEKPRAH